MGDDLPDPIVLDDPDFLGLVVVLLFLVHKMARIRKWFTIDSNFKRPIPKRTDSRGGLNALGSGICDTALGMHDRAWAMLPRLGTCSSFCAWSGPFMFSLQIRVG
jgi:hypothetical protein